ncbi:adenosylcobinamide-GDP ribazoletransferase [filamentous cyanobacterium CCP5]|nr:adenosylcobinamide-GDP ribazoletransferase [filamentous cyanobacterium CCP5]
MGRIWQRWLAALSFYTCLPVPLQNLEFRGIARYAPLVGLLIASILAISDWGLAALEMPILTRSALMVALWLGITGGLHLDGAMDSADGLAVLDKQRRLGVMADSHSGAFGVMAAVGLLGLKTLALADLDVHRTLALLLALGWSRWGQIVAIVRYPYLRPQGKGQLHQLDIHPVGDLLLGPVVLLGLSLAYWFLWPESSLILVGLNLGGLAIALATAAWFNHQFGGHTGDTYGATVEWTEALMLCLATLLV